MKKRNWMNKLSNRAMGMMAAMALMVTATTVNQCCIRTQASGHYSQVPWNS